MPFSKIAAGLALVSVALAPLPAAAQSIGPFDTGPTEARATLGFTVPLGARSGSKEAKPRLDFAFQQDRYQRAEFAFDRLRLDEQPQRRTVGLTLDGDFTPMLNGREMPQFDERLKSRGDTALVIGGVVLAGILIAIIAVGENPSSTGQ